MMERQLVFCIFSIVLLYSNRVAALLLITAAHILKAVRLSLNR